VSDPVDVFSTGWQQEGPPASKSLHQLPLMECPFRPLLFLHHHPFWERRGGMMVKRMVIKPACVCVYVCSMEHDISLTLWGLLVRRSSSLLFVADLRRINSMFRHMQTFLVRTCIYCFVLHVSDLLFKILNGKPGLMLYGDFGKYGDCSFSHFDSIVQTNRHTRWQPRMNALLSRLSSAWLTMAVRNLCVCVNILL